VERMAADVELHPTTLRGEWVLVQALALAGRGRYGPAPCAYRMRSRS